MFEKLSYSTMPPPQLTISVTLTSCRNPNDRRCLTLTPGKPCVVGRASKTKQGYEATAGNALFDCPVMSREHAELQGHLWAPTADQVTIKDLRSMHGTRVNGAVLERGKTMSLRSGDVLQFGERVSRGEDTHEGVVVTFDRTPTYSTQNSHTFTASQPHRGRFFVPDVSDDDEDSDSPIEVVSDDENEEHVPSSAHTTPEQYKTKLGSAEQPIDLDNASASPRMSNARAPCIIDLADDDDDDAMPPPSLPHKRNESRDNATSEPPQVVSSLRVVEDSIDKDNSIYTPIGDASYSRPSLIMENESTTFRQLGLMGTMEDDAAETSDNDSSDQEEEMEYDNGTQHEEELSVADNMDYDHDEEYQSDEDSPYDVEDDDEEEEREVLSTNKQGSPELGSARDDEPLSAIAPQKTSTSFGSGVERYDPVRGSQASHQQPVRPSQQFGHPVPFGRDWAQPKVSSYTYAAPPLPSWNTIRPHLADTDDLNSSRWDVGPSAPPPAPAYGFRAPPPPPVTGFNTFGDSFDWYDKPRPSPLHDNSSGVWNNGPPPFAFDHSWEAAPTSLSYQDPLGVKSPPQKRAVPEEPTRRTFVPAVTVIQPTESTKNKMSISDIVEEATLDTDEPMEEPPKKATAAGTKRKAPEISLDDQADEEMPQPSQVSAELAIDAWNALHENFEHDPQQQEVEERPAQKRRIDLEDVSAPAPAAVPQQGGSGMATAARYAGSAMLGGVATLAFLCSPMAEKALEWLA